LTLWPLFCSLLRAHAPAQEAQPFLTAVRAFEIRLLRQALREARYHQKKAAQRLGLTYHQFRGLCRKYGHAITQG